MVWTPGVFLFLNLVDLASDILYNVNMLMEIGSRSIFLIRLGLVFNFNNAGSFSILEVEDILQKVHKEDETKKNK